MFSTAIGYKSGEIDAAFYTAKTIAASSRTAVTRNLAIGDVVGLDNHAATNVPNGWEPGASSGIINVSLVGSATNAQFTAYVVVGIDDEVNKIVGGARQGGRVRVTDRWIGKARVRGGGGGLAIGATLAVNQATDATGGALVGYSTVSTAANQQTIVATLMEAVPADADGLYLVDFTGSGK